MWCLWGSLGRRCWRCFAKPDLLRPRRPLPDERYEPDRTLRSRKFEDALIRDPKEAARQALGMVERGVVSASDGSEVTVAAQTICIHGDTPGATAIAAEVARTLIEGGVRISALACERAG